LTHELQKENHTVLSYGAGVNTFALLLKLPEWNLKPDLVIFADTGNEKPQTYEHLEKYQIPIMEAQGLKFVRVKNENGHGTLFDYSLKRGKIPWRQTRAIRYCTGMFKVDPIMKYLNSIRENKQEEFSQMIGIAYDEIHRMTKKTKRKWITNVHPLIDHKLTREDCKTVIKLAGYEVPPKSGCGYCPFQKKSEWAWEAKNNPIAITQGISLEDSFMQKWVAKHGKQPEKAITLRYDKVPLQEWFEQSARSEIRTLERIEKDESLQTMLDETCNLGNCMT
jgi:3'-phosphoadenosine 5'-phosphosulfate sulfotransferase (PAPS reductase)/FAD synthetase